MRSCPIGVYPDEWHVVELARKQASLTHNASHGQVSSATIALACHYFLYGLGPKKDLVHYLNNHSYTAGLFDNDDDLWPLGQRVSSEAFPCVKSAISAVVRNDSMAECLKECIDYTGDVDSIAAMAMGIASCAELVNDLPKNLYNGLENGEYGLSYLRELDQKLLKHVKSYHELCRT